MRRDILSRHWFEIALVVVVAVAHIYAATSDAYNFPSSWFTRDDAYYYFKVAQNITEGRGMTFDGINPTNGYHPLWMLVNIPIFALARFDLVLPLRILLLLQGALSAGTALLIYRIVRGAISHPLAVLCSAWWAFSLYIHIAMYEYGLETGLASFAAAMLLYRLYRFEKTWRTSPPARAQIAVLAGFACLALFSRLDLIFLALLAGAWVILRGTRLRALLPLDMLLAVVSVLCSLLLRIGIRAYYSNTEVALGMAAISVISRLPLYYLLGLYEPDLSRPFTHMLRRIAVAVTAGTLLAALLMTAASPLLGAFPRIALAYDFAINLVGVVLLRGLARIFSRGTPGELLAPVALLKASWRRWMEEGVVYFGVIGIPLAVYLLFNRLMVGTGMPVSGQIKRWWGSAPVRAYGGPARSPLAFWGIDIEADLNAWNPLTGWLDSLSRTLASRWNLYRNDEVYVALLVLVCLLCLAAIGMNRRMAVRASFQAALPLLFVTSFIQVLSYNAPGYSALKEWYWITEPIFLIMALSLAAAILLRSLRRSAPARAIVWLVVGAMSLGLAWNFLRVTAARMPHGVYGDRRPTMDIVEFLEQHTPPGSLIGMTGGGNVGYYIEDRTIVNLDGLINSPAYFAALRAGTAGGYLEAIGLDFIFANPAILAGSPYRGQYPTGEALGRYGGKALLEFAP